LENERYGSGFFEGQIFRIRQAIYFRDTNELGAAAIDQVAEVGELAAAVVEPRNAGQALATGHSRSENYFLTNADAGDFWADLCDLAGDVAAGNMRKGYRYIRQALADPQVKVVQRAGMNAHEHFVVANRRFWDGGVLQNLGPTVLLEDDGFHSRNGTSSTRV
jgi:hypothetical protein